MVDLPPGAAEAAARQIAHYISGTEREPWPEPDLEDTLWATAALEAAAPLIAAAERDRIRQLAIKHAAIYSECGGCCDPEDNPDHRIPFADLLEDPPPGGTT